MKSGADSTTINIAEPTTKLGDTKAKPLAKNAPIATTSKNAPITTTTKATKPVRGHWRKRPAAVLDFILRLCAIAAALAAATVMGTTDQTLPFFTQFFQFQVSFDDLPALVFFVVVNGILSGYLVLSLFFSFIWILRPHKTGAKLFLLILDTVMIALTSSAAGAATAIVYLAHNGSSTANWLAMCQRFDAFCQEISGAVVASFIADAILILLVIIAALGIRKR